MSTSIPKGFVKVGKDAFEQFLKTCNDFTTERWSNADVWVFRHNKKTFAVRKLGRAVHVDPELILQP